MNFNIAKIYLFLLVIGYVYINNFIEILNSEDYIYWANLSYWLFSIPLYFYLNDKNESFPFIGLTGIFLLFSYSLPIFFISARNYQTGYLNFLSVKVAFYSYLVFFSSFFLFKKIFWVNKYSAFDWIGTDHKKIKITAYFFLIIHLISLFIPSISFVVHIGEIAIYIYIGLLLTLIRSNYKVAIFEIILFVLFVIWQYLIRFTGGLLATVALFSLFLFVIESITSKSNIKALVWLIPFLFSYIIFSPLKDSYRAEVWYSGESYTLEEQLKIIYDLYTTNQDRIEPSKDTKEKENFLWRYSYQMSALSTVLENTPDIVPYWKGESYNFFSKFIPRFLWPNKPQENMGYKFGVTYNIISSENLSTSMNTPILAEMYMNFGNKGIFLGMILFALICFILNYFYNNSNVNPFSSVISIAILFKLMIHESNFTLVFGNIPLMLITIYIIIKLIKA